MTRADYDQARAAHRARLAPWLEARHARRSRGEAHPVWDFLFEYYSFKPNQLARYSPGLGVAVGAGAGDLDWPESYGPVAGGVALDPARFPERRGSYLRWAVAFLRAVSAREPHFACFGLHEWAMVYRAAPRHGVPLRLGPAGTDAVVESARLGCTHYDAYRFFSPDARPRNRLELARADQAERDQPGCVHANMDLYKFAYKVAPFIDSDTLADGFELAAAARELDMRASPYDLRGYGFAPIAIETRAGRDEYAAGQRELARRAAPVRAAVLRQYEAMLGVMAVAGAGGGADRAADDHSPGTHSTRRDRHGIHHTPPRPHRLQERHAVTLGRNHARLGARGEFAERRQELDAPVAAIDQRHAAAHDRRDALAVGVPGERRLNRPGVRDRPRVAPGRRDRPQLRGPGLVQTQVRDSLATGVRARPVARRGGTRANPGGESAYRDAGEGRLRFGGRVSLRRFQRRRQGR